MTNRRDCPIYVSVEMMPQCFELEPGETLTLTWNGPDEDESLEVEFLCADELTIYPGGNWFDIAYEIDGQPAEERSWIFKHR